MKDFVTETYSGKLFDYSNPTVDMVCLEDIANGLSNVCRFAGQCLTFYSVAQHCVLVASLLEQRGAPIEVVRAGLFHDAAEAYLGDCVGPAKSLLFDFQELEIKIQMVIAEKFNLQYPWPEDVHICDVIALAREARDLMRRKHPWPTDHVLIDHVPSVIPMAPINAKYAFVKLYKSLFPLAS